jgi:hypothetical protein
MIRNSTQETLRKLGLERLGQWPCFVVEVCPIGEKYRTIPEIKLIKCYNITEDWGLIPTFYFARSDQLWEAEDFLRYNLGYEEVVVDPEENE